MATRVLPRACRIPSTTSLASPTSNTNAAAHFRRALLLKVHSGAACTMTSLIFCSASFKTEHINMSSMHPLIQTDPLWTIVPLAPTPRPTEPNIPRTTPAPGTNRCRLFRFEQLFLFQIWPLWISGTVPLGSKNVYGYPGLRLEPNQICF